jgi:photosystem II stability/assembly factor-like uncharacterized protein
MRTIITQNLTGILIVILLFPACRKDDFSCENIIETKIFYTAGPTDISFANKNVGYISGGIESDIGTAVIAKTNDGGNTWIKVSVNIENSPSANIRSIYAKSIDSVYVTYNSQDDRRGVCFSDDGGLTWLNIGNLTVGVYYNVLFKDKLTGFVCCSGDILQTKDGGNTWETIYSDEDFGGIEKLFFTSNQIGYAVGGYGDYTYILKTTDGGDTWTEVASMDKFITCLSFNSNNIGYAFTHENEVYKTTDGGITWKWLNKLEVGPYFSAAIAGNTKYFATGNTIYKTADDFKTITEIYTSSVYNAELSIKAVSPSNNTIFILSSQQSVIKITL